MTFSFIQYHFYCTLKNEHCLCNIMFLYIILHSTKCNIIIIFQGSVGYVPQKAWILNATLKENVLFGKPLNMPFYKNVIKSCALNPDLQMLPAGDMCEIGEKVKVCSIQN